MSGSVVSGRVLVLDANQRSALAVMRSLGRHGVQVLASDSVDEALAGASRYCGLYLKSPSVETEPDLFLDWLMHTVQEQHIEFIQPVTEITSQLLLANRERVPESCHVPFVDFGTLLAVTNKVRLLDVAQAAGVDVPKSRVVSCSTELLADSVEQFPVILKPALSRVPIGNRWLHTSVAIAHDRHELERLLQRREEFRNHPFLLQEFIPGTGAGVFALYRHGNAVALFSHRRLREKPPHGGVSVLSESAPLEGATREAAVRILDHVRWHGVAMVEFRVTPEGRPYLMEVNTRFWGSLQLAIDSGVDFPWLLYQMEMGGEHELMPRYRLGRRLRWLLGDLDSLYLYLRDPEVSPWQKLRRAIEFCIPRPLSTRHEVFRWSDPRPGILEAMQYLRALRK